MISEKKKAPDFALLSPDGKIVKLSDFAKKRLVLYFYPKDDTPGCTVEACGFRDAAKEYEKRGVAVVGISPDSPQSHVKFAKKYSLPFLLLSDPGGQTAKKYGVWGKKKFAGKEFEGVMRTTFVISGEGIVEKVFADVKPEGHEKEVLAWLDKNQ